MARKKYLDESEEQQQENRGMKSLQNKRNILASSPPRSSVLGLIHRGRTNQKIQHHPNNGLPLTAEESLYAVIKQLSNDGLTIREMPGDGNCLFRALSDQLEGNTRNHLHHRRAVVQYMKDNRSDFEPFVEDDEPFEKYVHSLAQPGTFAGNDAIVAFARLHNVTVVIHQLNSPAWLIHATSEGHNLSGREVHIAYHNGDHYNSVRKIGDDSDTPANIRFITKEHPGNSKSTKANNLDNTGKPIQHLNHPSTYTTTSTVTSDNTRSTNSAYSSAVFYGSGRDEDFWVKDDGDIDRLVEDVLQQTDYPDPNFVKDTLIEFNFDMNSTVDFILSMSFIMSQSETETSSQPTQVIDGVKEEAESLARESGKVLLDLDTGVGVTNELVKVNPVDVEFEKAGTQKKTESVESEEIVQINTIENERNSPSPPLSPTSDAVCGHDVDEDGHPSLNGQNKLASRGDTKAKLSTRQKNDIKKKERKREAEKRKKLTQCQNSSPPPPEQYSVSNLRSLNI